MIVREERWKPAGRPVTTERADPAAPPLCTVNRGTAGVGLIKKKEEKLKGEEISPLLRAGHWQGWPVTTQTKSAAPPVHSRQGVGWGRNQK